MRRAERRKVIGAAAVVDVVGVAAHRGRAIRRALQVDPIFPREQLLEPRQGGERFRIEDAVRALCPRRMDHAERDGDVELPCRRGARRFRLLDETTEINAVIWIEMGVEPLKHLLRGRAVASRPRRVADRLHPCRSVGERGILREACVIMMA